MTSYDAEITSRFQDGGQQNWTKKKQNKKKNTKDEDHKIYCEKGYFSGIVWFLKK